MTDIYAYSIMATRRKVTGCTITTNMESKAGACLAINKQEALGIAHEVANKTYKTEDGYSNQSASVVKIPNDWIKYIYKESKDD